MNTLPLLLCCLTDWANFQRGASPLYRLICPTIVHIRSTYKKTQAKDTAQRRRQKPNCLQESHDVVVHRCRCKSGRQVAE